MKLPWISRKRHEEALARAKRLFEAHIQKCRKTIQNLQAENIALHRQAHDMIAAVENSIEADKPKEE